MGVEVKEVEVKEAEVEGVWVWTRREAEDVICCWRERRRPVWRINCKKGYVSRRILDLEWITSLLFQVFTPDAIHSTTNDSTDFIYPPNSLPPTQPLQYALHFFTREP